jgi:hypothetical protein
MSSWEERMAARHKATVSVDEARRRYLGEVFLQHYPPDTGSFEPQVEILPQIIAANCLGITYGDPGPPLESNWCRECWGERHVWLGNTWGLQHAQPSPFPAPRRMHDCGHSCHEGEHWLASAAGTTTQDSAAP